MKPRDPTPLAFNSDPFDFSAMLRSEMDAAFRIGHLVMGRARFPSIKLAIDLGANPARTPAALKRMKARKAKRAARRTTRRHRK